ncbi:MAG TPA: hypothetical protein VEN81_04605 [Planctomycetota bacterium]|nr:hypothetical protein [Planctomycetota bacterium]
MRSVIALAVLAACCASGFGQDKKDAKGDPDRWYKPELGISIQKPAKNDEWEFKDHGLFTNSIVAVSHKVDHVFIELFSQDKASGLGSYDPKAAAEQSWKQFATDANFKDAKKVQEIKAGKLPNGGANNPMAYFLDLTCKDKGDRSLEIKLWCFVGKENQNFYKVFVIGDEGMYKKYQKNLDLMLGSIQILKIPK